MASHGIRVDGRLVWTYFFTHWSARTLLNLRHPLERQGYKHVDTAERQRPEGQDAPVFRMSMARTEFHTPESLHERLADVAQKAIAAGVDYDGWEAGHLPHQERIVSVLVDVPVHVPVRHEPSLRARGAIWAA